MPPNLVFDRFGGSLHLRLSDAEDLARILQIDKAHWVATSAPVSTLRADTVFLQLIDTDQNGRISVFELEQAIRWLLEQLHDTSGIAAGSSVLSLAAINRNSPDGDLIARGIEKMLLAMGQDQATQIGLDEIRQIRMRVEQTPISAAGVVLPEAAEDEPTAQFLRDLIAVTGGAPHPSGKPGIGSAEFDAFLTEARAYLTWHDQADGHDPVVAGNLFPLGADTPAAYAAVASVKARLDQYFALCEAMSFLKACGRLERVVVAEPSQNELCDPAGLGQLLTQAPLAAPAPDGRLEFGTGINPQDRDGLVDMRRRVLVPLLGEPADVLTGPQWESVKARFDAYRQWTQAKPDVAVACLGVAKLRTYCDGAFPEAVRQLIRRSEETALQIKNVRLVEKLALYQAHLMELANNFVSFPHLYNIHERAMFEAGSLIMDGRHFNLAVAVDQRAEHVRVAGTSNMFVLYVQLERREVPDPIEVAVPVTGGGQGNLVVGKRGIFVDVQGHQWDARVLQIIENPISLREAMLAPFRRISKLVTGKIEQLSGTAANQLEATTNQAMTQIGTGATSSAEPTGGQPAQGRALMVGGLVAGGGVALAALGSAAAFMTKTLSAIDPWLWVVGLGGAVVAVLLPSTILGAMKLRRRDLGAVLEGSGWAINARMRLSRGQGRQFTVRPAYPRGARGVRYWSIWIVALLVAVLVATAVVGLTRWRLERAAAKPPAASPAGTVDPNPAASSPDPAT